jgi:acid stress-induced BolA-like protein IbaG/YrbA
MENDFLQRLTSVMGELGFGPGEFSLERTASQKVGGVITSSKFRGKTQIRRQQELWDALREHLSEAELNCVVALLTVTPDEVGDDD